MRLSLVQVFLKGAAYDTNPDDLVPADGIVL